MWCHYRRGGWLMELNKDLKHAICALFEVHEDEQGVQRVITPLEYPGSSDKVVVRVRPRAGYFQIDENGEAALYASMQGGEIDSEAVARWSEDLHATCGVSFEDGEQLQAEVKDPQRVAPAIFQVAATAQQMFALATSYKERAASDFKDRVAQVVVDVAKALGMPLRSDVELPFAGNMVADHVIDHSTPLIIIAASSTARLLEAEVIHMQYRYTKQPGFVLAVAESERVVGKKQFHRANYYTGKTVEFSAYDFGQLLREQLH